jgi:hypothetical protein
MAALVEPLKARPRPSGPDRYPCLTDEERGLDPSPGPRPSVEVRPAPTPPLELGPPPLWVAPSDVPAPSRALGFFDAVPELETIEPDPPTPEGLFDVPGLLERLWLARALEAGREKPVNRTLRPPSVLPMPALAGAETRYGLSAGHRVPVAEGAAAPAPPRPVGWICPRCYLTNEAEALTCRGCERPSPRP